MTQETNRVWIELDEPKDDDHAKLQCELATKMIRRLGVEQGKFWWHTKNERYCFGDHGGYKELPDRGMWFNLDFLSGERS